MKIEIGFTPELTNTHFAPLALLSVLYQQQNRLDPLQQVHIPMRNRYFSSASKLIQVLLSILTGYETLSQVNQTLKQEGAWHLYGAGPALLTNRAFPERWTS